MKQNVIPGHHDSRNDIVVVSGLPRSGTSMMMQMLERGGRALLTDGIRVADDHNPRGYFEFEAVKRTKRDPSWLDQAEGRAVKMVHLLLLDLPVDRQYRVILMRRRLDEVLASQHALLDSTGREGAAIPPSELARVFEKQLKKVVAFMRERTCFAVLEVRHDEVLRDPSGQAAVLNEFLGGGLNLRAMAAAVEPTLYRRRR